jgi:molecular chaperone HtpG
MNSTNTHSFQAETTRLLDLMIHSLYSNKEIFLRELISNASDALDKLRFAAVADATLSADDLHIRLTPDATARTLTITDNGIGMTREEMLNNLGTIARSGTKEFLESLGKADARSRPELIGQFGVGFYSSFLVASKVEVISRRAGTAEAHVWSSSGDGKFTLEPGERSAAGTTIVLHLKPVSEDDGIGDYTRPWELSSLVKKYSDFVNYPIRMREERPLIAKPDDEADPDANKPPEDRVLNSMKAIWMRPKAEITDEEYNQFYKHIAHDWTDPAARIGFSVEGNFEARGLLFIPSQAPFDLFRADMKHRGVHLYIRRVFIQDDAEGLVPHYLRFLRGIVDAEDLPLNVSREILQTNAQVRVIRRQIIKKVLEHLATLQKDDRKKFDALWEQFGAVLKEGLLQGPDRNEKILDLVVAPSTRSGDGVTSLGEYVERMKPGQEQIYYLTNVNLDLARRSPHLEAFAKRELEVLFFTNQVDALWLSQVGKFKDKKLVAIDGSEVALPAEDGAKSDAEKDADKKDGNETPEMNELLLLLRARLQDTVKDVRVSSRLTDSPACLITDRGDMTPQMERLLKISGQEVPPVKRVLEVNATHPALQKLAKLCTENKDNPRIERDARLLYGQALLAEGGQLDDPAGFARLVADLMVSS